MIEEIRPESKTDVAPIPFYIYIYIFSHTILTNLDAVFQRVYLLAVFSQLRKS